MKSLLTTLPVFLSDNCLESANSMLTTKFLIAWGFQGSWPHSQALVRTAISGEQGQEEERNVSESPELFKLSKAPVSSLSPMDSGTLFPTPLLQAE